MKIMNPVKTAVLASTIALSTTTARAADDVVIVYDASGSMWGQIDGTSKIEIARTVMADLVTGWAEDTNLGLVAYGHRRKGDCTDIETLITPAPLDKSRFIATVDAIKPNGKTPISAAVQHAADLLSFRDTPATVVLISDGVETCNADPCALAAQLAKQGVAFTVHVVGFDLKESENASLSCIAENTGGVFVPASNAAELKDALAQVQTAVEQQPPAAKPDPIPAPEPAPAAEVTLTGPAQVTRGAVFILSWSPSLDARDFVTIVPVGAKEGAYGDYEPVVDKTEGELTAPGETGMYELRYVRNEGRVTLGTTPIEVVEAAVSVTGPAQVTTGANFEVVWTGTVNPRDFITIVPTDAKPGAYADYVRTGQDSAGELTAPAETGLYELRYVLEEGKQTIATATIEVVSPEIGISGPATVQTGAEFDVSWAGAVNPRDYLTIVPAGAKEGTYTDYVNTGSTTEGQLTAPAEAGLFELRYVLEEGAKTLASIPIEVTEPSVTLTGPAIARAGTAVSMTWSETVNPRDFLTIVPAGADQGSYAAYLRTDTSTTGELTAPAEPGLYEIRYVLDKGRKTLASAPLEVVAADAPLDDGAGLSVPASAAPGETITVTWTGSTDSADQRISLARKDQPDFSWVTVQPVTVDKTMQFTLPTEPGLYEVRYLDITNRQLLGRAVIEVK
jgi:Ca-activated chloride channel family protein